MINLLSVDLEDWHTSGFLRQAVSGERPPASCIREATIPILNLFKEEGYSATFFVLGSIAAEDPDLIKEIDMQGHEIASHGYSHTPLWELKPEAFRKELKETSDIIEEITGKRPVGFRAPCASLDENTSWAVNVLQEEGYRYDSSIFPMKTPIYGAPGATRGIYRISSADIFNDSPDSSLLEFPFSVCGPSFFPLPCTGGIYGRVIPYLFLKPMLKSVVRRRSLNFYFHPWETYAYIPRLNVGIISRMVSYYNIGNYLKKIRRILGTFKFTSFENYIDMNKL
ncbi:MAG: DUF3473 domain-containing protein [Elusimicrobia bacterium]|nr:DUF3473 domain-containing protein [Elusimicrobiota bacterium]